MDEAVAYRRLLRKSGAALLVGAVLVAICYFFVDRPVAQFVHHFRINHHPELKVLTYPPPIIQGWAPVVLTILVVRRAWGPFRRWERALLAASVAVVLADQFKESLASVFGRYWPETWIDKNPSLIENGAYGFHPFHGGPWYGSFPSGHTARTVAAAAVVWVTWPRWRWACVLGPAAVVVGLVGMNYHFVGDVVGGGFVGAVVGVFTAHFCGLPGQPPKPPDRPNAPSQKEGAAH